MRTFDALDQSWSWKQVRKQIARVSTQPFVQPAKRYTSQCVERQAIAHSPVSGRFAVAQLMERCGRINQKNVDKRYIDSLREDRPVWSIDVLFPLVCWLIEGFVYPLDNRQMMIDGIPNRPLYFTKRTLLVWSSFWLYPGQELVWPLTNSWLF